MARLSLYLSSHIFHIFGDCQLQTCRWWTIVSLSADSDLQLILVIIQSNLSFFVLPELHSGDANWQNYFLQYRRQYAMA